MGSRGIPYAFASATFHPAPMPMSSRPPEKTSNVAAMFASTAGFRYGFPVTNSPRRRRRGTSGSSVHSSELVFETNRPSP
jgi:hypothetical protein